MSEIKSMDRCLNNLDLALNLLNSPNVNCRPLPLLNPIISRMALFFKRFSNFLIGDHCWYNESKARKIIKYYIWTAKAADKNDLRTQKVEQLFDRISLIKKGNVSYVDRIEKDWIKKCAQGNLQSDPSFNRCKNQSKISNRIFFHLHANQFGNNSELEGSYWIPPLKFLLKYLSNHQMGSSQFNITLLKELQGALAIAELGYPLTGKKLNLQKAFQEKTNILIPGGWSSSEKGHALYYEIIPETVDTFSFRIYNTGLGVQFHNKITVGGKEKVQPYLEWKGISKEKLMYENFWEVINEIRYCVSYKLNGKEHQTNYSDEDVYVGLKKVLEPKEENVPPPAGVKPEHFYMKQQVSGVCAMRSLLVFLHARMEYSEYKLFKCTIRLQTLIDKVDEAKSAFSYLVAFADWLNPKISRLVRAFFLLPTDPMIERNLIEKSRNKLLLALKKSKNNNIIGNRFWTKAQYELDKISDYMEETKTLKCRVKPLKVKWEYANVEKKVQGNLIPKLNKPIHLQCQGLYQQPKNEQIPLPLKICHHPNFKELFPKVTTASQIQDNVFYFKEMSHEILVRLENGVLTIDKRRPDSTEGWLRFISSEAFAAKEEARSTLLDKVTNWILKNWKQNCSSKNEELILSSFQSRHLINNYSHWQSYKTPSKIYLQNTSGDLEYEASLRRNKIIEVRDKKNNFVLGQPSKCFSRFEDASYIQEWYSSAGVLQGVELPRFGLTFTPSQQKPPKLNCDQYPGYIVKSQDVLPELGSYRHYLVLENSSGQRKVILPQQKFIKHPNGWETLLPRYAIELDLKKEDKNPQKYCSFDVTQDGKLLSQSIEANLYLALLLTLVQEYQKASYYLKQYCSKTTSYSKDELNLIEKLISLKEVNGDGAGDAAALRVYAVFLWAMNSKNNNVPLNESAITIIKFYPALLKYVKSGSPLKLNPEEAQLLLEYLELIIKNNKTANISTTVKPAQTVKTVETKNTPPKDLNVVLGQIKPLVGFKEAFKSMLISRPYKFIMLHNADIINLARSGNENEKQRLRYAIAFLSISKDQQEKTMGAFLQNVMDNPLHPVM